MGHEINRICKGKMSPLREKQAGDQIMSIKVPLLGDNIISSDKCRISKLGVAICKFNTAIRKRFLMKPKSFENYIHY